MAERGDSKEELQLQEVHFEKGLNSIIPGKVAENSSAIPHK